MPASTHAVGGSCKALGNIHLMTLLAPAFGVVQEERKLCQLYLGKEVRQKTCAMNFSAAGWRQEQRKSR